MVVYALSPKDKFLLKLKIKVAKIINRLLSTLKKDKKKKTVLEGKRFFSPKEANRYLLLQRLEQKGRITNLKIHPSFEVLTAFTYKGSKQKKSLFTASFQYNRGSDVYVENAKGLDTYIYRLKKRLFLNKYGKNLTFIEI